MNPARLDDLLVLKATQALKGDTVEELEALLAAQSELDGDEFERAAAAIALSSMRVVEPLPASVRRTVERDAAEFFAAMRGRE